MAEKRALVAAVLMGANASEFFTQDMEDSGDQPTATTAEEFDVAKATQAARLAIGLVAYHCGLIEGIDDADGKNLMLANAVPEDLTVDNMLTELGQWLMWIEGQAEGE
jgi:hypothetical protein